MNQKLAEAKATIDIDDVASALRRSSEYARGLAGSLEEALAAMNTAGLSDYARVLRSQLELQRQVAVRIDELARRVSEATN